MESKPYNLRFNKMSLIYFCLLVMLKYTYCSGILDLQDFTVCKDHYGGVMVQETWTIQNVFYCYFHCGQNSWCRALTIKPVPDGVECTFHSGIFDVTCNSFPLLDNVGYRLLLKNEEYTPSDDNGCLNGGTFHGGCVCQSGFAGPSCERYVYDCKEAMNTNVNLVPGAFTNVLVKPPTSQLAFVIFCNPLGATVILARNPRTFDLQFNRTWDEYKYAFGININMWMGLEWIHKLSSFYGVARQVQLYCGNLDMNDGFSVYYSYISLEDENLRYKARVGTVSDPTGDILGSPNLQPLCTYDNPCNGLPNSTMGGWWYTANFEKFAQTHPGNLYCKHNGNDFEAHSVSIDFQV